jgi:heme-degrading monooxygenase HmoA
VGGERARRRERVVIAVVFELVPREGCRQTYLDIAASLYERVRAIDGFVSIERFQSLSDPRKLLSLSFWRDEAAVERWRTVEAHRAAQRRGRASLFEDYRLRVAVVSRDYGMNDRREAPGV